MRIPRLSLRCVLALAAMVAVAGCQLPRAQVAKARPVFYPSPPDSPRVQYLTAINASWDVVPERSGLARLVLGPRDKAAISDVLERPHGIAVRQGKVYVCDHQGGDVKVFNLAKKTYALLSGARRILAGPTNLCIDKDGYIFVVESMRNLIQVFDTQDNYLTTFRVKDGRPGGVAVVGSELFVTDVTGDRILVLDRSSGKLLRTLGGKGSEPGQFLMPNAIAADADGNLYVSDQMNFRFQKLDRTGKALFTAGGAGDSYGHFARPRGIAVGPDGVIYVVESIYEVVQMFSPKGEVLMGFGNFHAAPGFVELPAGVAVDKSCLPYFAKYVDPRFEPEYLAFVVSQVGAARVGVYAFGHLRAGAELPQLPPPKVDSQEGPVAPKSPKQPTK